MADPLATEILSQLFRKGALDLSDVEAIASRLEEDGEEDAAHRARSALIEAGVDREAERDNVVMIRRMKLGPVADGGNSA
jgi:hypothetical protein